MGLSTQEAILQRRSVKSFDKDFIIPQSDIDKLLELAIHSPSSFNIQHWRIVNVTDVELRELIQAVAWGQAQVTDASHLFIICADIEAAYKKDLSSHYWKNADDEKQKMMLTMLEDFYRDNPERKRDEAIRSASIMSQTIMLAAKSMGYDSCPMIGFDAQKLAKLINLPDDYVIAMMLPVGKAFQDAHPRGGFLPIDQIVYENSF